MALVLSKQTGDITVATGTGSVTINFHKADCRQIVIDPPNASDTYDVAVINADNLTVFDSQDNTGTFNELLNLPIYENVTLQITNGSSDGAYTYLFAAREI